MISKEGRRAIDAAVKKAGGEVEAAWWRGYFAGLDHSVGLIGVARDEALKAKVKRITKRGKAK